MLQKQTVNNFFKMTVDEFKSVIDVNLNGTFIFVVIFLARLCHQEERY